MALISSVRLLEPIPAKILLRYVGLTCPLTGHLWRGEYKEIRNFGARHPRTASVIDQSHADSGSFLASNDGNGLSVFARGLTVSRLSQYGNSGPHLLQ